MSLPSINRICEQLLITHVTRKNAIVWAMKKVLVLLFPWTLIAGILDYRFHEVYWPSLNFLREPFQSGAMFDFFSVFAAYELILILFCAVDVLAVGQKGLFTMKKKVQIFTGLLILCFLVGGLIALLTAHSVEPVIKTPWDQIFTLYLLPILTGLSLHRTLRANPTLKNRFIKQTLLAFTCFAAIILFEYATNLLPGDRVDFVGRLVWPYVDPFADLKFESANWLSFIFSPIVILSAIVFLDHLQKKKIRALALLSGLASLLVVLLSQSYTGIGILFILLAILLFTFLSRRYKIKLLVAVILLAIVGSPFIVKTQKFQILLGNYHLPNSVERREQIYEFTWETLQDRFWTGIGPGNYQSYFRANQSEILTEPIPERELPPHPHNLLLAWWSDLGALGLLGGLLVYVGVLYRFIAFLRQKNLAFAPVLIILYFLGHGLLDTPYANEETAVLFWTFASLMLI